MTIIGDTFNTYMSSQGQGNSQGEGWHHQTRIQHHQRLHVCAARSIYAIEVHTDMWINTSVEFPDDTVQTFESTEHVHVEQDGAVNTQ